MSYRHAFRLPATLTLVGFLGYVAATALHTGGPANDHPVIFGDYAGSGNWMAVHVAQFTAMAVMLSGLIALRGPLGTAGTLSGQLARLGATMGAVALGLYGVLQAVDGVALKHAVDAWAGAPLGEKADRFIAAETVRWLEWGTRSFHTYALGAALVVLGAAAIASRRLPRTLGALIALSGAPALVQGWELGAHGFTDADTTAILAGYALTLTWTVWLTFLAWRREPAGGTRSPAPQESPQLTAAGRG
jgi:hypothetical protein